ncbi:MAG: hypothetical protein V3U90_06940 [Dehalococcoidia bacterium]
MKRNFRQQWLKGVAGQGRMAKGLIALVLIGVLFQSFMVVDASSFTSEEDVSFRGGETFTDDTDIVVTSNGIRKITSATASIGDKDPGVEATHLLPQINNALVSNHYAYMIEVKEATVDSWAVGDRFEVELYGGGSMGVDLLATLYVQQAVANHDAIEGVTVGVDVGSSSWIPDFFNVIVTRQ